MTMAAPYAQTTADCGDRCLTCDSASRHIENYHARCAKHDVPGLPHYHQEIAGEGGWLSMVKVDSETKTATHEPDKTQPEALIKATTNAGFPSTLQK